MIILENVSKVIKEGSATREVLSSINVDIPTDRRIALIGSSAVDRRAVIELLAGALMPTTGRIVRRADVSFPVGALPGFNKELSARVNIAHVARLYGANVKQVIAVVESMLGANDALDCAFEKMPRELRSRLAPIVALTLPFDAYLFSDDKIVRSRAAENEAHRALLNARANTSGLIIATNDYKIVAGYCDLALEVENGQLKFVNDIVAVAKEARKLRRPPASAGDRRPLIRG